MFKLCRRRNFMFFTILMLANLAGATAPVHAACDLLHPQDCLPKEVPRPPMPPTPPIPSHIPPTPPFPPVPPIPTHIPPIDPLHPPSPGQVIQIVADAINALQSQTLTGPLLANAIQASRDSAYGQAMPIPQEMRWALVGYASQDSLDRVRYKIGDNGFANLARLIEQGGQASAVTLVDVIIFRGPTEANDPSLWAHELTHVDQYASMTVQGFAAAYTQDYRALEDPAYAKQAGWQAWYDASHQQANTPPPPQPLGEFCITQMGRFGPGPAQPIGSPCRANVGGGFIIGQIGL
ncbi:hypothetical protein ACVIWU_006740 [Bradyrhizobium sp. USDA 4509]